MFKTLRAILHSWQLNAGGEQHVGVSHSQPVLTVLFALSVMALHSSRMSENGGAPLVHAHKRVAAAVRGTSSNSAVAVLVAPGSKTSNVDGKDLYESGQARSPSCSTAHAHVTEPDL